MNVLALVLVLIILALISFAGLILVARRRNVARGLPPPPLLNPFAAFRSSARAGPGGIAAPWPTPRTGGLVGWLGDRVRNFRNRRFSRGAYEEAGGEGVGLHGGGGGGYGGGGGRRARGLDPDEAWDARVGNEADGFGGPGGYYEEQELGLRGPAGQETSYGGRRSQDELDRRYDEEMHGGAGGAARGRPGQTGENPFADGAETSDLSLRGVSPRPVEDGARKGKGGHSREGSPDGSPTERRSMFRENV